MNMAKTSDSPMASTKAPTTTRPTESLNIDSLEATSMPSMAIRSAKARPPTMTTPMARTLMATTATSSADSAIRSSMPLSRRRPLSRRLIAEGSCARAGQRPVAGAAHRSDVARLLRIVAQLGPQPPDVSVDGPVQDHLVVTSIDGV